MEALIDQIDFIEALNSRIVFGVHNKLAMEFARRHNKPTSAASDAHSPREVGRSYVELPPFTGPGDFLQSAPPGPPRRPPLEPAHPHAQPLRHAPPRARLEPGMMPAHPEGSKDASSAHPEAVEGQRRLIACPPWRESKPERFNGTIHSPSRRQ